MSDRKKHAHGKHPNTLANLTYHEGRPLAFGEAKKRRNLSVTEEAWIGLQPIVEELGCNSVSDLLEKLGRGVVKLSA
jgi:hypothetical protein